MSVCFRTRFALGDAVKLTSPDAELVLTDDDDLPEVVTLKPWGNVATLSLARQLILCGTGYESEERASDAASRWNAHLQAALARCEIGVDFGDRAAKSALTEYGLAAAAVQVGRVLHDVHGTMVFAREPTPKFLGIGPASLILGKPADRLVRAIRLARQLGVALSPKEQVAYDLYAASFFFHPSPDARFTLLMMALEVLIDQRERASEVIAHVEVLINATRDSQLPQNEIRSITDSLTWLRKESIGQAGRRLACELGERQYIDKAAVPFFTDCYELRSALVHGHHPRPTRGEVDRHAAALDTFVSHLLSGRLLAGLAD